MPSLALKTAGTRFSLELRSINMSGQSSPSEDRISDLPNCLMQNILSHLPLRDAVKTSTLSTNWRNKWLLLTHLKFDDSFSSTFLRYNMLSKIVLFKTIYQVLLRHGHDPIHKITLSFPGLVGCPDIDFIAYHLSKIDIQELTLCFSGDNHHRLPSYLFSCVNLRYLELCNCLCIPQSSFGEFNQLTILHLRGVDFTYYNFVTFLSKCPLLEELTIENCFNTQNLVIDAPNLKSLYYDGILNSICFKRTTVVTRVTIFSLESQPIQISDINGFFTCSPLMEKFVLNYPTLMSFAAVLVPERLLAPLHHLKSLEIRNLCFGFLKEVSCALYLIRSCPNLTILKILEFHENKNDELDLALLGFQDLSNTAFNQLQELKMLNFGGTQPEIEFVRIILARSPLLQRLHIEHRGSDINEQFESLIQLTGLQRVSPTAKILFCSYGGSI